MIVGRRPDPPTCRLHPAVAPAAVALAGLSMILAVMLAKHGFNPTGLIHIGDWLHAERFWTETTIVEHGLSGYDGQYFFYLAHDPALRTDDPGGFLDHPAYRYARILYPALVWASSFGRPDAIPWTMLVVNLAAAAIGTVAAVDVLRSLGANRWVALGYAFSPAIVFGLTANLAEPTAYALIAVGVALALRGLHGWAGLALAIASLGREVTIVVSVVFALHAILRRAWREAASYLVPLVIPVLWHLWILARLGTFPSLDGPPNFSLPFLGPLYRANLLLGVQEPNMGEPPPPYPPGASWSNIELVLIGVFVTMMLLGLAKLFSRRDLFALQLGAQCALGLFASQYIWVGMGSYTRVLGMLVLFYALALLAAPRRQLKSTSAENCDPRLSMPLAVSGSPQVGQPTRANLNAG